MGLANIGSAFTGGLPVTTSISRSAVNFFAGANTGLSSIVAGGLMTLTTLFLTPLFFYLPQVALAAIIFTSVINLFDFAKLRQLWQYSQTEAVISAVTMVSVFVAGIEWGILIGIGLTVVLFLYRTSRLEITELGRIGYTKFYDDINHHDAVSVAHVLMLRLDESLYFANSRFLDTYLRNRVASSDNTKFLILECSAVSTIDASAVLMLEDLVQELQALDMEVYWVGIKGYAFRRLGTQRFLELVRPERFFATMHAAVDATGQLFDDELPI
jgi:SulP family sulfate permease